MSLRRLSLITALALIPGLALADEAALSSPSTPSNAVQTAPSGLGPDALGSGSGGSNADAGALQPAGTSPLQSTSGDSTGLAAPNINTLQAPAATNANLEVLQNEADGEPQQATDPTNTWNWLWLSLLFGLLVAGGSFLWRNRKHLNKAADLPDAVGPEEPTLFTEPPLSAEPTMPSPEVDEPHATTESVIPTEINDDSSEPEPKPYTPDQAENPSSSTLDSAVPPAPGPHKSSHKHKSKRKHKH